MDGIFDEYNEELRKAWGGLVTSMNAVPFVLTADQITQRYFYNDLIPTRITYSPPATICYFPDGDKVVAMCGKDDVFSKEVGVMVCIMKKLFGSYHSLSELAETGNEQVSKESKYEKTMAKKISQEHVRRMINRIEQIPD